MKIVLSLMSQMSDCDTSQLGGSFAGDNEDDLASLPDTEPQDSGIEDYPVTSTGNERGYPGTEDYLVPSPVHSDAVPSPEEDDVVHLSGFYFEDQFATQEFHRNHAEISQNQLNFRGRTPKH